ncbi:hypothetical protein C7C46_32670 [Streptomyces tateyamensis]|uniref:Uncharacterized protein n=1 Tax=Streptomyces tateyamensis TaxID=565073 RepID=A0A2V4N6X9_9ACTN|nr:hypothetical protein C7C46_32670 [Streptomyces tateyamensis]
MVLVSPVADTLTAAFSQQHVMGEQVLTEPEPEHVAMAIGQGLLVQAPYSGAFVSVADLVGHGTILDVRRVATVCSR